MLFRSFEEKRDSGGVKFLSISEEWEMISEKWENEEVPQLKMATLCLRGIVMFLRSRAHFPFSLHRAIFPNSDANSEALRHFMAWPADSGGNRWQDPQIEVCRNFDSTKIPVYRTHTDVTCHKQSLAGSWYQVAVSQGH